MSATEDAHVPCPTWDQKCGPLAWRRGPQEQKAIDDSRGHGNNYSIMSKPEQPFTDALRQTIADSGMAHNAIERATGVKRQSIALFMRGERSLRLDLADRLATFFGLTVRRPRKGR